ncbi:DsbA family protein [Aquirhabdus parva]|uniref:DsbA family protein n=1 Tax=Aquirhabdus parva TaxID=2283318 RepID=A0A345P9E5_9GAMM|nr:DsbA family protein [Aquirhabdus parva]AXI03904.1 DsbA family protein [Aquirhabdus parva]
MKLIYVGDPMCSWCYGFGKELTALIRRTPDLSLEIVVGGVRAGATDVLDEVGKRFRLQHWNRVEGLSGLPFNRDAFKALEGFVYDTEPVCRAVVTARHFIQDGGLLAVFRALQDGFYARGDDTTQGVVLAKIATEALQTAGQSVGVDEFLVRWASEEIRTETAADFVWARSIGVQSFPALWLEQDGRYFVVSPGYASVTELEHRLSELEVELA